MNRSEIATYFPLPGVPAYCGQLEFEVPDFDWLLSDYWDFIHSDLWYQDLAKWGERWVCEDFAAYYRLGVQRAWAKASGVVSSARGVAVGEIHFLPHPEDPTADGHAICPAWRGNELVFIDPQSNQLWPMSPAQLWSRYYLRF